MTPGEFQAAVSAECRALADLLTEKNAAYGNSALDPLRVFSKASVEEQFLVRIDDKLSRLARGSTSSAISSCSASRGRLAAREAPLGVVGRFEK